MKKALFIIIGMLIMTVTAAGQEMVVKIYKDIIDPEIAQRHVRCIGPGRRRRVPAAPDERK